MKKGFWNKTLALVLTASMAGAYLPADVQAAGKTANEPFAAFTFDDEESGFTSAGGTAEVKGSYRLDQLSVFEESGREEHSVREERDHDFL